MIAREVLSNFCIILGLSIDNPESSKIRSMHNCRFAWLLTFSGLHCSDLHYHCSVSLNSHYVALSYQFIQLFANGNPQIWYNITLLVLYISHIFSFGWAYFRHFIFWAFPIICRTISIGSQEHLTFHLSKPAFHPCIFIDMGEFAVMIIVFVIIILFIFVLFFRYTLDKAHNKIAIKLDVSWIVYCVFIAFVIA